MKLIRPLVAKLQPYVPGEQPKISGLVKLNTNENPYPPAPAVLTAVKAAVDDRFRLYPNPVAQSLREKLARLHGCEPENIIAGNGSDELLAMLVRCFADPAPAGAQAKVPASAVVQFLRPCYSLYPVLVAIHGAAANAVPLGADFSLPRVAELRRGGEWNFKAALTFITTPNAPSGRGYASADLEAICQAQRGVVVLDEAYVDFARENALALALKYPNVIVARTFSKAYSLCFQRIGYCVGAKPLIEALHKIRDSYNVNGLGQVAAEATLENLPYYRANFKKIIATRERLTQKLGELGFETHPSQTNFILVRPPRFPAKQWLEKLREQKVLVRWFKDPAVTDFLRISIGSEAQADALLKAARRIMR
jgi:histidinol-phosphate aminotransferase